MHSGVGCSTSHSRSIERMGREGSSVRLLEEATRNVLREKTVLQLWQQSGMHATSLYRGQTVIRSIIVVGKKSRHEWL